MSIKTVPSEFANDLETPTSQEVCPRFVHTWAGLAEIAALIGISADIFYGILNSLLGGSCSENSVSRVEWSYIVIVHNRHRGTYRMVFSSRADPMVYPQM